MQSWLCSARSRAYQLTFISVQKKLVLISPPSQRLGELFGLELNRSNSLKKLSETEKYQISRFYEERSRNRLETAKLVYDSSRKPDKNSIGLRDDYKDYAEAVSAAYYSMYYIVHAFLASVYKTKIREGIRGVHIITEYIILYYLVKTERLARHLYEDYLRTLEAASQIQRIDIEEFQGKAYGYVKQYDKSRAARETFTYNTTLKIEEYNAKQAIDAAEEFINTIRQLMISK